jgi:hypothetical protein
MRRLLRWTFNTLAAASLLLCLATAGLWVRSYWVYDWFYAERREVGEDGQGSAISHYDCTVVSYRGRIGGSIGWSERPEGHSTPPWEFEFGHPSRRFAELATDSRLRITHAIFGGYTFTEQHWAVPAWALVSAFAVLPLIVTLRQVRTVRRRQRARLGCCPACGYDLRATPERCPECGRKGDKVKG